jgi:two-component system, LytTR family, response regulator
MFKAMQSSDFTRGRQFFFVREDQRNHRVDFDKIQYVESAAAYCRIVTAEKSWAVLIGIWQLEALFPAADFLRIHRSFLVAYAHIEWFDKHFARVAGRNLPIGRNYMGRLEDRVVMLSPELAKEQADLVCEED